MLKISVNDKHGNINCFIHSFDSFHVMNFVCNIKLLYFGTVCSGDFGLPLVVGAGNPLKW